MKVYDKPIHYTISHVLTGFIASYYTWVGVLALVYQVTQLAFNIRFFPVEGKIGKGNSIEHTIVKLLEMLMGYSVGKTIQYYSQWNGPDTLSL